MVQSIEGEGSSPEISPEAAAAAIVAAQDVIVAKAKKELSLQDSKA